MAELRAGQHVAGFRLEARAGEGGMGVVWRARQLGLDRTVAVKVIAAAVARDPTFRARFEREARLLAAVEHPHVIPIYQAGEADGQLFLAMRWVDGRDLANEIAATNGLAPQRALALLAQIAGALDAVHQHGLVHRDVKPANVLLERRPDGEHAYLSDFGAGRHLDAPSDATAAGQWLGTVDYLAPEMLAGAPADAHSDLYALGCVLFETLTGTPPYHRDTTMGILWAHQHDPPPSVRARRPSLPPALDAVLARALAKDPAARYPTATRLAQAAADALQAARGPATQAAPALPPGVPPPAPTPAHRRWWRPAAALLVALAAAGAAAGLLAGSHAASPGPHATAGAARAARVTRVPLGAAATASSVVADAAGAYVLDVHGHAVVKVDSTSRRAVGRVRLPGVPRSLAVSSDDRRVWVGLRDRRLVELDRARPVGAPLALPIEPDDVAVLGDEVVVLQHDPARLLRVDARRRRPLGTPVQAPGAATGLLVYGNALLIPVVFPANLVRFDRTLHRQAIHSLIGVSLPTGLAVDGRGILWVSDFEARRLLRLDPATGATLAPAIAVGRNPTGVALDGTSAWVANKGDSTVTRIDLRTGRAVGQPVATGPLAGPIAARQDLDGGAWVPGTDQLLDLEPPGA